MKIKVFNPQVEPTTIDEFKKAIAQLTHLNTALHKKIAQLETQNICLHTIIDHIPIAMFVKNARDNFKITLWNKTAETTFNLRQAMVIGKMFGCVTIAVNKNIGNNKLFSLRKIK